mgnify:CR=1 FL=1|tara:strand:+ start:143 stop:1138 length:996 start_codon:yes stop_codon:yes gene_type:complete
MQVNNKPKLVTGLTATGDLHLGSYLGTIKQWRDYSQTHDCYFFIADMHAITTPQDPAQMRTRCLDMVALFLSSGVDLKRNVLFNQSQVPQHAELAWVLSCVASMGELQRMTQFKEKAATQKRNETLGLFAYPCLMAADILLYNPTHVPVGEDQKQHLELARNLAQRFNHHFKEIFTIPEPIIPKIGARVMALGDPSKKMSKSDSTPANTIYLLDTPEKIIKKIKRAVTDSEGTIAFDENRLGISNLVSIYAAISGKSIEQVVQEFNGAGYAPFKTELADIIIETFKPIREHYATIRHDEDYLLKCLNRGAEKARTQASQTLAAVYDAVGFL